MNVETIEKDLKAVVDTFMDNAKDTPLNPFDYGDLVYDLVKIGVNGYHQIKNLPGKEKKQAVTKLVQDAIKPALDYDIEQVPNWIEEAAEASLRDHYIPKAIDRLFAA